MRTNRATALAALTTMTLAAGVLSACGSGGTSSASTSGAGGSGVTGSSEGSSGSDLRVAAIIKGLDNPFFQSMEQGIKEEAKSAGVSTTVQAAGSITDTTGQADKLNGLAGQDFDCYVVNPITGTNLIQGVAQLAAQDKTIVNIDSPIQQKAAQAAGATIDTYVGTDNVQAGKIAGQEMTKLLAKGGGDVAAIGGTAGDVTSGARIKGFKKGIGDDVQLIQTVAADWSREEALTKATNILQAHPELAGFFVANDDMALGVARAAANQGKADQVHIVSVDGIKDALKAIQAGKLDATVSQYPYAIGKMGMQACEAASQGKELPKNVKAPVALITQKDAAKALASFPKPFKPFSNPYVDLLK